MQLKCNHSSTDFPHAYPFYKTLSPITEIYRGIQIICITSIYIIIYYFIFIKFHVVILSSYNYILLLRLVARISNGLPRRTKTFSCILVKLHNKVIRGRNFFQEEHLQHVLCVSQSTQNAHNPTVTISWKVLILSLFIYL